MIRKIDREKLGRMELGQDLVAAGYIGELGTAAIARAKQEELLQRFSKEYFNQFLIKTETDGKLTWENAERLGATEFEMTGEGGIFTALWTLSGTYHTGISIDLRAIPVRQSTIELCERYELTPYRLWSSNCAVMVEPALNCPAPVLNWSIPALSCVAPELADLIPSLSEVIPSKYPASSRDDNVVLQLLYA